MGKHAFGDAKEKTKRFRLTGLGMARILLISALVSLAINTVYLVVETVCIKSGNGMPICRKVYGGECIENVGVYWFETILVPLTSTEDATPAAAVTRQRFVPLQFLCAFAALFVIVWLILSLINKHFKPLLIIFGGMAAAALVFFGGKALIRRYDDEPQKLILVSVVTSDLHPGICSGVYFPYYYVTLVSPGDGGKYGRLQGEGLYPGSSDPVHPEDVGKVQLKELLWAAHELEKSSSLNTAEGFAYKIRIEYESRHGKKVLVIGGYGDFPEEYANFVRVVNEICGMDLLREDPEAVTFSYEWFSDTFGIYDSDLPEGATVEGYMTSRRIRFNEICGLSAAGKLTSFDPADSLEQYLLQLSEESR